MGKISFLVYSIQPENTSDLFLSWAHDFLTSVRVHVEDSPWRKATQRSCHSELISESNI